MKFSKSLAANLARLKRRFPADDILTYEFEAGGTKCAIAYLDGLADKELAGEQIVRALMSRETVDFDGAKEGLTAPELKEAETWEEIEAPLLGGDTIVFLDGSGRVLVAGLRKYNLRSVAEPPTSTVIKGPREGFIEDMKTNLSMLRRRLRTPDYRVESVKMGKYTGTSVAIVYVSSVVRPGAVEEVKARLGSLETDGVFDSSYLARILSSRSHSLFRQIGTTEKPDVLAAKILEGRVGVIVDGSPLALTLPYVLLEDFQSSEDYFTSNYRATVSRLLRVAAILLSVLLPALFVSAQLFHLQLIPLNFLLTIVNSIKGIPLSPSFEMFFTLLIFEILNEASVRMPKYVGMALSIVGALVLGDTAVRAGIVSTPTIMIMALSGISMYTVPELVETFSLLRIAFLFLAGSVGAYGIVSGAVFLVVYLAGLENFGVPLLAPYAPLIWGDLKDGTFKRHSDAMRLRPAAIGSPNAVRMRRKDNKETR